MEGDTGGVAQELSAPTAIRQHLEQADREGEIERKARVIPDESLDSCCPLAFPFLLLIAPN